MSMMLSKQLTGYRLTTAEITYCLPDFPELLQEFIWQHLDLAPEFPELKRFLNFWERRIDGKLHSVRIASATLISPARMRYAAGHFSVH
ncbi:MAG: Usg family protein [Proteobacteria bacterium]|nr:Usg family protein [Pseudomonadota bacterium]